MNGEADPLLGEPLFAKARSEGATSQLVLWPAMESQMDELDASGETDNHSQCSSWAPPDLERDAQSGQPEDAAGATTYITSDVQSDTTFSSLSPTVFSAVLQQSILSMQNFAEGSTRSIPMPSLSPCWTSCDVKHAAEMMEPTMSQLGIMSVDAQSMRRPGSLVDDGECGEGAQGVDFEEETVGNKKARFIWSTELHRRFEMAVAELGVTAAKPQAIADLMGFTGDEGDDGPSRKNIKSHLQKYRLRMKKRRGAALSGCSDSTLAPADSSAEGETGVTYPQPSHEGLTYQQPSNEGSPYEQPSNESIAYQQPSNEGIVYQQQQPSHESISYQQPRNEGIAYQQPSNGSISYQQPSNEGTAYQQPSSQSMACQQPSSEDMTYQQPSNEGIAYQQPSNEGIPYQQPSNEGIPYQQPRNDQIPRPLSQLTDYSVAFCHENGEVKFSFNDTHSLAPAPSTANVPCGLAPTSSTSSSTTVQSPPEAHELAECEVFLEALNEAMLRSLSEMEEEPKASGPPSYSSEPSTISVAAGSPNHATSGRDGFVEEADDAEFQWACADPDGFDTFLPVSTVVAQADHFSALPLEPPRKRRNLGDVCESGTLPHVKRSHRRFAY